MSKGDQKRFTREFKLAALQRMAAGENVSELARELGVLRKCLYQWRDRYRLGGAIALRSRGRMTKAEALAMRSATGGGPAVAGGSASEPVRRSGSPDALAQAQRRIAELERKVGQQQVDLDFFQQALRQVRETRLRSGAPGGTASTRSSKE
ncbi:MAG TPA: helix-turn-helix domain-containing protein [Stellaceae bacterium]|nr:helix-turn-helix domain-containing protein [Stellaceae bacterium]